VGENWAQIDMGDAGTTVASVHYLAIENSGPTGIDPAWITVGDS